MSYVTLRIEAVRLLNLAATYADDGAILTAISRTERALRRLREARTEQAALIKSATEVYGSEVPQSRAVNRQRR